MIKNNISTIHAAFDGATCQQKFARGYDFEKEVGFDNLLAGLDKIGMNVDAYNTAMDAIQALTTTPSVGTPVQFLQAWLPGYVRRITASRKIDDILGRTVVGEFSDAQVVQGVIENTGVAGLYTDQSDVPLTGFNTNFVYRDTVRFEAGFAIGMMEMQTVSKLRIDAASEKRLAATEFVLEVARNRVGFYGYNAGNNQTYGFLNDPNLDSYQTVATGAGGSRLWANKTMLEIQNDIVTALSKIREKSRDTIDPEKDSITLVVATAVKGYLSKMNDFGITAYDFLKQNYPNIRVISAPELDAANGGANVFYVFADKVNDSSSDGQSTFVQLVPTIFMVTGVMKILKGYKESFANCLAGVLCKRPYAVYRGSGI